MLRRNKNLSDIEIATAAADAEMYGNNHAVRLHGIPWRRLEKYRIICKTDPRMKALKLERIEATKASIDELRVAFMKNALAAMHAKLERAKLKEVVAAFDAVSRAHQSSIEAAAVLGVGATPAPQLGKGEYVISIGENSESAEAEEATGAEQQHTVDDGEG